MITLHSELNHKGYEERLYLKIMHRTVLQFHQMIKLMQSVLIIYLKRITEW